MADAYTSVRRYPMLRFAGHVDWKHMKLAMLNRLNALGSATHQTIYIFSGYRSNEYSAGVGGFAGDPHTFGMAADAYVGGPSGKSIGSFYSAKVLAKYGLRSGNQPNFYHGKPDPSHVDLVGFGYDRHGNLSGSLAKDPYASKAAVQIEAPVGTQTTQPLIGGPSVGEPPPTQAGLTEAPGPLLPGTVSGNQSPVGAQAFWKRVLEQPNVSAETQATASLYQ